MARVNRLLPALAVLAGVLLAGCSAPAATTPPATAGVSWPGTGYVLTLPAGSVDVTGPMKQQLSGDPAVNDIEVVGSPPEGLPVVMTLSMPGAAAMGVDAYRAAQEETGLVDVHEVDPVTLDGRQASGVLGSEPDGLASLSYLVPLGDDLVVVMFLGPDPEAMQPVVDFVVANFRWG